MNGGKEFGAGFSCGSVGNGCGSEGGGDGISQVDVLEGRVNIAAAGFVTAGAGTTRAARAAAHWAIRAGRGEAVNETGTGAAGGAGQGKGIGKLAGAGTAGAFANWQFVAAAAARVARTGSWTWIGSGSGNGWAGRGVIAQGLVLSSAVGNNDGSL